MSIWIKPENCICAWYPVHDPYEPHIPAVWDAEQNPACPVHFIRPEPTEGIDE